MPGDYGACEGAPAGGQALPRPGRRRSAGTALAAVAAACCLAAVVFVAVTMQHGSMRRTELWGWTKDSMESGDGKISAEEVEQLDSVLEAQNNLKKNLKRMAEKLDKGRGTEIAVEQGNNSPPGPDGERGAEGPKGPPGPAGVLGPPGPAGKEGMQGMKGKQGDQGVPGKRGSPGPQGEIGPAGLEGPKGNMGAVGYPGAPGAPGPQGPPGPEQPNNMGAPGPMGHEGPMGPDGPNGDLGPRGPPGGPPPPPPSPVIILPPAPPPIPPVPEPVPPVPQPEPVPPIPQPEPVPPVPQPEPVPPVPQPEPVPPVPQPEPVPPVPPAPPVIVEADMGSASGLNMECSKWRDNKDGVGNKPNLQLYNQMKQMAYCMQQDCVQSLEAITCRYVDENHLCYTNPGQLFCAEHPGHSKCIDLGAGVTATNLDGPGAWAPKEGVPVFGTDASAAGKPPYECVCYKNCVHYTGSNKLKKYRCTGGLGIKVGAAGGPHDTATPVSLTKNGECACSCGYPGDNASWQVSDAQ